MNFKIFTWFLIKILCYQFNSLILQKYQDQFGRANYVKKFTSPVELKFMMSKSSKHLHQSIYYCDYVSHAFYKRMKSSPPQNVWRSICHIIITENIYSSKFYTEECVVDDIQNLNYCQLIWILVSEFCKFYWLFL